MDNQGNTEPTAFSYQAIIKRFMRPNPWPKKAVSVPQFQCHRGYWIGGLQENTLAAFRKASQVGAEMAELDVHLSKDNIPVVFHDDDLERLGHEATKVSDLTAAELQSKVKAPSLRQLLLDPACEKLKFNIELKTRQVLDDAIERKVFEVIDSTKSHSRVLISSFNPMALFRMSLHTNELPMALIAGSDLKEVYLKEFWFTPFIPFHCLHLDRKMLLEHGELAFCREHGILVSAWTINNKEHARELLDAGVFSIISDSLLSL